MQLDRFRRADLRRRLRSVLWEAARERAHDWTDAERHDAEREIDAIIETMGL